MNEMNEDDIIRDELTARELTIEEQGATIGKLNASNHYLTIRLTRADHHIEELRSQIASTDAEPTELSEEEAHATPLDLDQP